LSGVGLPTPGFEQVLSGAGLRTCKFALRKCGADEPDAEPGQKRCGHSVRESAVEDLEPSVEDQRSERQREPADEGDEKYPQVPQDHSQVVPVAAQDRMQRVGRLRIGQELAGGRGRPAAAVPGARARLCQVANMLDEAPRPLAKPQLTLQDFSTAYANKNVRPRQYEVWLGHTEPRLAWAAGAMSK
jgi:hypothetical protein